MGLCPETPVFELLRRNMQLTDAEVKDMWYDWFCRPESLVNKGRRLLSRLSSIAPSPRFEPNNTYIFFKNNCPLRGKLYDDFRICDIKTGNVIYCVTPHEGYDRSYGESCVWGNAPDTGQFEELVRGTWKDVKQFFRETDKEKLLETVRGVRRYNMIREAEYYYEQWKSEQRCKQREEERAVEDASREYVEQLETMLAR